MRSVTRDVGPLTLRAEFVPSTLDADKRTAKLTWSTGARVLRGTFEPYYEELSLDPRHVRMQRLQSGAAPLLNNHSSLSLDDVIGVIESATLDRKHGTATVRFARTEQADRVMAGVSDGILRNVSVGYRTFKMEKVDTADGAIPVYRAIDWEPHELSIVPMGADAGAAVRAAAETNHCEFTEERTIMDPIEPTPAPTPPYQQPVVPRTPVAPVLPVPLPAEPPTPDQIRSAERDRVTGIQRRGASLSRPQIEIDEAIRSGAALESFTSIAVDKRASEDLIQFDKRDSRIASGEDRRDKWMRGASAWLIQRAAVGGVVAAHAKARGEKFDSDAGEFRGLRMIDLARQSLDNAGVRTAGMLPMDLIGAALMQRSPSAGTGDFPMLLENTLYKVLLASYATTPDTWRLFSKVGSVQDFRPNKRYRMGSFGSLSPLNELGEYKNKSIPDAERQSITAATKGNIIGISRQAIINDEMDAFSSLATMLGRAAKLTIEVDVYATLALNGGLGPLMGDGLSMFHAAHGNITPPTALGSASLDTDRVAMASIKDPSNNEILALTPTTLLLGIGQGGVARQINLGLYDYDDEGESPNRVGNLFREIVDTPRIIGTRRYLFADPAVAPVLEVAFLDGQEQPFMDTQTGWRIDGTEWKVRLDFGVAGIDYRGAITNAGA